MVSASLRQFLQSLCCTSPWDYAVMWRLQLHQGQELLTWDDGVFDIPKPREPMESMMDSQDFYGSDGMLFSTYPSNTQSGNWVDSPIAVLVTEMSSIYYVVGKGVVGEVAHTETSRWIYADELMCGEFQCPDELLHQFVAGIKTILLVPLGHYGVLQLGSLDKVADDAELVMCVKKKFEADQQYAGYFALFSSERKLAHMTGHADNLGQLSDNATNRINRSLSVLDNVVESNSVVNVDQMMKEVSVSVSESKSSLESGGQFDFKEHLSYPFHEHGESDLKQNFPGSACLNEDLDVFSYFTDFDMMPSEIPVNKNMQDFPHGSVEPPSLSEFDHSTFQSGRHLLRFSSDCELHKVFGSGVSDHVDLEPSRSDVSCENAGVCEKYNIHCNQPSAWDYGVRSDEDYKVEDLLEAVFANASRILDDNSSKVSPSPIPLKGLAGNLESCDIADVPSEVEDLFPCVTSLSNGDTDLKKISPLPSSFNCIISSLVEERPQKDGKIYMRATKGLKQNGSNKRRARLGDNQKSRPRDRQLIQDRIKELRELVPHSAKGSIDSLLDRTIKHMQFLRSVTNQADKIKPHVINKASEHKALRSPLAKGSDQNGTSWAVELSGKEQTCPIIVKDLEYPGHMLIEMLCSDHGRFLEIADVIHRLKLTILKGWMKKRSDDCTWAHFIVEASGGFHRLDIFWPLMQLVQQNKSQISSRI